MYLPPYQQRVQVWDKKSLYPDYYSAILARVGYTWSPLYILLKIPDFTPLEISKILRLREEYESGGERKG